MFGGKVNKQVAFTEHINMRPFMSDKEVNIRERDVERDGYVLLITLVPLIFC